MREAAAGRRLSRDTKRREKAAKTAKTKPFESNRDPIKLADGLDMVVQQFSWSEKIAEADLQNRWADVVGPETAAHSMPEDLVDSTLIVRCTSTAWATQLRLLGTEILKRINEAYPELKIDTLKTLGPDAPSWKKGPLSVPGRGPRDTYG